MRGYTKRQIEDVINNFKEFDKISLDIFTQFDEDRSGNIELHELINLLDASTDVIEWTPPNVEELKKVIDSYDENSNSRLNFYEFKPLFKKLLTNYYEEYKETKLHAKKVVRSAGNDEDYDMTAFRYFRRHDYSDTGNLNRDEIAAAFKDAETDYNVEPKTKAELEKILQNYDFSTDQALNFHEFKKVFYKYMLRLGP